MQALERKFFLRHVGFFLVLVTYPLAHPGTGDAPTGGPRCSPAVTKRVTILLSRKRSHSSQVPYPNRVIVVCHGLMHLGRCMVNHIVTPLFVPLTLIAHVFRTFTVNMYIPSRSLCIDFDRSPLFSPKGAGVGHYRRRREALTGGRKAGTHTHREFL